MMASGRPIVAISPKESELGQIVSKAGIQVEYEKGYGVAIGACLSPCDDYLEGVSLTSKASAGSAPDSTSVKFSLQISWL